MEYDRPLPKKSLGGETEPYWDAAREERLVIQRCGDCDEHVFPPRVVCPYCLSKELTWVETAGTGEIYAHSTVYHPPTDHWTDAVPFTLAIIHLDEDVYLFSSIENCAPEEIHICMPVKVTFDHVTDEVTLPKFEPQEG